jgi:hypothetical protein
MIKTKQELIDEVMDNFDFSRVAKVMEALDWTWFGYGVPAEPDIRSAVRKHLSTVYGTAKIQGRKYGMATGGFSYEYDPQNSELSLAFNVTSYSTAYGEF